MITVSENFLKRSRIQKRKNQLVKIAFLNLGDNICDGENENGLGVICQMRESKIVYNEYLKKINKCMNNEIIPTLSSILNEDEVEFLRSESEFSNAKKMLDSICGAPFPDREPSSIAKKIIDSGMESKVKDALDTCMLKFLNNTIGKLLISRNCLVSAKMRDQDVKQILMYMDDTYNKRTKHFRSFEKVEDIVEKEEKEIKRKKRRRDISNMFFV